MEKSLEQWKRDHEIPWGADLKVETVSWSLGDWRTLTAPELRLRARWVNRQWEWDRIFDQHAERWQKNLVEQIQQHVRHQRLVLSSPEYRAEQKRKMNAQLEVYRALFQTEKERAMMPPPRRSEHVHMGVDFAGPSGNTVHYTFTDDEPFIDMEEWPDRKFRAEDPNWKREVYGNHPDPPRCDNRDSSGLAVCKNVATLRVIDRGQPTDSVCCVPCSRAYPKFTYQQLRMENDADRQ